MKAETIRLFATGKDISRFRANILAQFNSAILLHEVRKRLYKIVISCGKQNISIGETHEILSGHMSPITFWTTFHLRDALAAGIIPWYRPETNLYTRLKHSVCTPLYLEGMDILA